MSRHSLARMASLALVFLLGLPCGAGAQASPSRERHADEIAELLAPGADPGRFAGEDAVYLFAGDTILLHADGRIDRGIHRVIRLNTALAVDEFGDPRIPYDTLRQELVIHACHTYALDGRVVASGERAFNRVTPDEVAACARDLHHQEVVLTLLGIERGCTIEYDVEVRDRVPSAPWLEGSAFFRLNYPVARRVVTVQCPAGVPLRAEVVGQETGAVGVTSEAVDGETSRDGGRAVRTHIWRAESLPAAREADDGVGGRRTRAHLLYSTCPSWDELAQRVAGDLTAAAQADEAMLAWLAQRERESDWLTDEDAWSTILGCTSRLVRDLPGSPAETYRSPRPAPEIFAAGCGDPWEKAALALALGGAFGLQSQPCLRAVLPEPRPSVPALAQFAGLLLRCGGGGAEGGAAFHGDPASGEIHHDPRAWGDAPLYALAPAGEQPAGWSGLAEAARRDGTADVDVGLVVGADGKVSGDLALSLAGTLCPAQQIGDPQAFARDYAERLLAGAEVTGISVARLAGERSDLRVTCAAPALGEASGAYRYLALGDAPLGVSALAAGHEPERAERTTALVLPGALRERVRYRLLLPEGVSVSHAPRDASLETEVGGWRVSTLLTEIPPAERKGARWILEVEREVRIDRREIEPALYGEFRRLLQAHQAEAGRLVVLRAAE